MQLRSVLIFSLPLVLTACGSSSSSSNNNLAPGPLSGNWQMALQAAPTTTANITAITRASNVVSATVTSSTGFSAGNQVGVSGVVNSSYDGVFTLTVVDKSTSVLQWIQGGPNSSSAGGSIVRYSTPPKTQSGFLIQNGGTVTGSVIFTDQPCSGVGSVTGTVSGTAISLLVSPTGVNVNLSGTIGSGQNSMSGNYTTLSTGCSATDVAPGTGIWTANRVKPLSGNIQGTFTSNDESLSPVTVTGKVSQGPNTGISTVPLTGSLSATDYCFSTADISGVVSGTSVLMNLVSSDGTQIGQVSGTTSLDGTFITGTYQVMGQGKGAEPNPPCVEGDHGTVTLNL
jgi:hypothetical protein